jgi:hypothetical protein
LALSRKRKTTRALPHVTSFETISGTTVGGVAGWPQPGALLMSGAVAQTAPADEADGLPTGVDRPVDEQPTASRASAHSSERRRRGPIGDRVSPSVGTCRRGRMAAS